MQNKEKFNMVSISEVANSGRVLLEGRPAKSVASLEIRRRLCYIPSLPLAKRKWSPLGLHFSL